MANHVFTGTATGHTGLLAAIRTHLTNAAVMGTEVWVTEKWDSVNKELYMRAPGLNGTDRIHVNFKAVENLGTDVFNLQIEGAVAFNTLVSFTAQPGVSPLGHMYLWDSTIPYWIIANGRRAIIIAKVSTTYQSAFVGFYLPYSTSSEMPYPIAIMTSGGNNSSATRWSAGTYQIGSFWDPIEGSSYIRHWNGSWVSIENLSYRSDTTRSELGISNVWPWEYDYGFGINLDGQYGLLPAVLHSSYGSGNALGELEGVFFVSGFSQGAEDTITVGSDNYLVVQSAYRTGRRDYAAIKLG